VPVVCIYLYIDITLIAQDHKTLTNQNIRAFFKEKGQFFFFQFCGYFPSFFLFSLLFSQKFQQENFPKKEVFLQSGNTAYIIHYRAFKIRKIKILNINT